MNEHEKKRRKETDALKREALMLGIQIPRDPDWWYVDEDVACEVDSEMWDLIRDAHEYLTDFGVVGTRKLIREERQKLTEEIRRDVLWERQKTQWKLTIAGLIVGWILGLSGIVLAIISLFKK